MEKCVIVHSKLGVFMGAAMGMAYWSKLGDAGCQFVAPVFANIGEARGYASQFREAYLVEGCAFFVIPEKLKVGEWADSTTLKACGVTDDMLETVLVNEMHSISARNVPKN